MGWVLTLIAGNNAIDLSESVAKACTALQAIGATVSHLDWLCSRTACDIYVPEIEPGAAEGAVKGQLAQTPIDFALQPVVGRRKRLLVADMESTIITRELIDELASLAGLGPEIAEVTARTMRGEIDFSQSLRERVAMLAGQPAELLSQVEKLIELTSGARRLARTMSAHGARTVLVSGGFDRFAAIVAEQCGFDEYHANRLEAICGRLTGRVVEPIIDRVGKRQTLERIARQIHVPLDACAAVGDGANDIDMLRYAGLGVAFHAKPVVAAAARFRLNHADLTGLLYLQGYHSTETRE